MPCGAPGCPRSTSRVPLSAAPAGAKQKNDWNVHSFFAVQGVAAAAGKNCSVACFTSGCAHEERHRLPGERALDRGLGLPLRVHLRAGRLRTGCSSCSTRARGAPRFHWPLAARAGGNCKCHFLAGRSATLLVAPLLGAVRAHRWAPATARLLPESAHGCSSSQLCPARSGLLAFAPLSPITASSKGEWDRACTRQREQR